MAEIVTLEASELGALLGGVWSRRGGHHVSNKPTDLSAASIVLFGGAPESLHALTDALSGKMLIDCGAVSGPGLGDLSRTESIASLLPDTSVVKAFCNPSLNVLQFVVDHGGPEIGTVYVSGLYCGNDADAKAVVAGLIAETNLDPVDCGKLARSTLLDSLALLEQYLESEYAMTSVRLKPDSSPADVFF